MAIFGLGAYYQGRREDVTDKFVSDGMACVGWNRADAPALHNMMAHMNVGDIIYIKSHPIDRGLIIKAVGIIADDEIISTDLGDSCLRINWIWIGNKKLGRIPDKYNVRNNTLYVECNPTVQKTVVNLLTAACTH